MYAGADEFVQGCAAFVREGLAAEAPTLVMVGAAKLDMLREELGPDAEPVQFADMETVGANPARIIPAWREFADANAAPGRPMFGIGEPIWAGRTPDELVECQRHESLLNVAFADAEGFRLLCPYDTEALDPDVVHEAHCSHPVVVDGAELATSSHYRGFEASGARFTTPLPTPSVEPNVLAFGIDSLGAVRRMVSAEAQAAGLSRARIDDLLLAISEIASNSIRHAGGRGVLRVWREPDTLICEVEDPGTISDPLVGRITPTVTQKGGHGFWIVHQTCDLVQIRSLPSGTVVRVHMRTGA